MPDNINWFEVRVKFASLSNLMISLDDSEKMFQAVREALKPYVDPKQLDISQVRPAFVPHDKELRMSLLQDLKVFQHVTNKGYADLRIEIERLRTALGFNLKGGPKDEL